MIETLSKDIWRLLLDLLDTLDIWNFKQVNKKCCCICDKLMDNNFWRQRVSKLINGECNKNYNWYIIWIQSITVKIHCPSFCYERVVTFNYVNLMEFLLEVKWFDDSDKKGMLQFAIRSSKRYEMIDVISRYVRPKWEYLEDSRIDIKLFKMLLDRAGEISGRELCWLYREFELGNNKEVMGYLVLLGAEVT